MVRRGLATIGVMLLLGAAAAAPAVASSGYTFTGLNGCCALAGTSTTFDGAYIADGVNNLGDVAVTGFGSDGHEHPFLYKNGTVTQLDDLLPTPTSNLIGLAGEVNDSDVVIGTVTNGQSGGVGGIGGSEYAAIWEPFAAAGSTTPFSLGQLDSGDSDCTPSGQYSRECYSAGTNINDAGVAAGYGEIRTTTAPLCFCTVPWALSDADPATLSLSDAFTTDPGGANIETSGINAAGQVVASPDPATPTNANSSAIFPGDTPIPFDASHATLVYDAINDMGEVIGADVGGTNPRAKLWDNGTLIDLPPLTGDIGSAARGINDNGDVVGTSMDAGGCPRAVLWQANNYGHPVDLNSLVGGGDTLLHANAINDSGQIVGQGGSCTDNNAYQDNIDPWLLTPPFHGTVLDAKGKPIVGAAVTVTGTTSLMVAVNTTATTGSDGSYTLDLDPGTYTLDVTGSPGQPPPGQPAGGVWHTDQCPGTVPVGGKCVLTIAEAAPGVANFRYSLPDFEAENVEITQGIQDVTWDAPTPVQVPGSGATPGGSYTGVPLVKDVPTVVWFYADVANDIDAQAQDGTAELYGYSGTGGSLSPLSGGPLTAPARSLRLGHSLAADRSVPDGAYTFTLPPAWTEHGPLTLVAEVDPKTNGTDRAIKECIETSCDDNDAYALTQVPFKVTQPVTIRPIQITYEYPNATGHGSTRVLPPDLESTFVRAAQLLPLAPGNLIVQSFPQAIVDISPEVETIVDYYRSHGLPLSKPNLSDCEHAPSCAADLLGFEFDAINRLVTLTHSSATRTFMAAYEPGAVGATWPTKGFTILGLDDPPRPLTSTTHELLHLLGFQHASTACGGGSNGQIGVPWPPDQLGYIQGIGLNRTPDSGGHGLYDIIAPGVGEPEYYDLMSYCTHGNDKLAWLSTVNWTKFVQDDGVANDIPNPPAQASTASAGSDLLVDASMAPGGQAQIEGAVGAPGPATHSTTSAYHLEAIGQGGKVIANIGVAPQTITESPLRMFSATLPAHGVTSLALTLSGHAMAKLKKPSPAPTVKLVIPRHGLKATRKGLTLKWRAKGAKHAKLTAIVQFLGSRKQGWQTVIAGLEAHSYKIALKQFGHARKVQVRVVISDGFSSAIATSRSLKLP